ncbi:MAG: CDP-diacylglycerol--serine O-phosphatidyltransferase [Bauldia sp.]|nr:CDP-diacylglycerol--serine O-phosphatidyltransferase [Bauldia sp.]MCW5716609.1 CDP-diacylglycerol--serine O-phosphatidyltransferase [Bauldia sp.]
MLLPNMVTLLALCSGLTAIRMAVEGRFEWAIYGILASAVLDGIDGRIARLLRSTSRFGAQLDSLADFVSFGVAPAILLFAWSLSDLGSAGWVVGMVFAICAALRLARFNSALDGPAKPAWQGAYFVGVPAPAGAVIAMLPIYVEFIGAPHGFFTAWVALAYTVLVAFLMVSRVPTFSGKHIGQRIPRDLVLPIFLALVVFTALLVSFPWWVLTVCTIIYLGVLPLSWRSFEATRRTVTGEPLRASDAPMREVAEEPEPLRLEPPPRNRSGPRRERSVRKSRPQNLQ